MEDFVLQLLKILQDCIKATMLSSFLLVPLLIQYPTLQISPISHHPTFEAFYSPLLKSSTSFLQPSKMSSATTLFTFLAVLSLIVANVSAKAPAAEHVNAEKVKLSPVKPTKKLETLLDQQAAKDPVRSMNKMPARKLKEASKTELSSTARPYYYITCESWNYRIRFCNVGRYVIRAAVYIRYSNSACVPYVDFTVFGTYVVVADGCRARFLVETA